MANEKLAARYALAVFELAAQAGQTDEVGRELRELSHAIDENEATKEFFISPVVERREKERVFSEAFGKKTNEIVLHTLLLLVRKRREALLDEIVRQYQSLQMQARGVQDATVVSARQLDQTELRALSARMETAYGRRFEITQRVDPTLIGGLRLTTGDRRIDGSIEGRLEDITRAFQTKGQL